MSEPKITGPNEEEVPIFVVEREGVHVMRLPDDPIVTRVSCGKPRTVDARGTYCVFRGPTTAAIATLKQALAALEAL